jgi:hypothetical protein
MPRSSRREFIKAATTVGAAALTLGPSIQAAESPGLKPALPPRPKGAKSLVGFRAPALEKVRWGNIGLGGRGSGTLRHMVILEGSQVTALCDNYRPALDNALKIVAKEGKPTPADFGNGDEDFRRMVQRDDVDAVMICTPWRWHVPMAVAAMKAGKHAFIEVPAAVTLDDCWQLVDTAEQTQRHCAMLENCCYGRDELMLLRMCREGVFGELLHGEGSYLHDLRSQMKELERGEGTWRIAEHVKRNGNLYPTHGLGPVAQYLSINRGDRFERLASFSSPSAGLQDYAARNLPANHPRKHMQFACGDMNTSIVKTARGRTIVVQHDTTNANPYSRTNLIRGTRGLFAGYPSRIYVEGRSPKPDQWEMDDALLKYYAEFDHPLWKKVADVAAKLPKGSAGGHGGMDFVLRWRIVQCLREGLPLDQDVYDAAAWSAIGPVSEHSVAQNGTSLEIPDFTRGAWQAAAPLGIAS